MAHASDVPLDLFMALRGEVQDIRRLADRLLQLMLLQLGTLATALASLVAAIL